MALRGAEGDRRAQRGSSRSRGRAASWNHGVWKALGGQPVGVEVCDKPSGVARGECRHPNKKMPRPTCYKERLSHTSESNFSAKLAGIKKTKPLYSDMTSQSEAHGWHCAARREIAERSEEAPAAGAAQPSRNYGEWKALGGQPVGVEVCDKPSGVVRGECRGGLGGAAAPNRPPSAARRAGGPNLINEKPPCPQGTEIVSQKTGLLYFL